MKTNQKEADEQQSTPVANIVRHIREMLLDYKKLATVTVVEQSSLAVSISVVGIIAVVFTSLVMIFAGLGLAWWVGAMLNNLVAGFLIASVFYLVLLVIVISTAKSSLIPWIRDIIIRNMYHDDDKKPQ